MEQGNDKVHRRFIEALDVPRDQRAAWVAAQSLSPEERELLIDLLARDDRQQGQTAVFDSGALGQRVDAALLQALVGTTIGDCVLERPIAAGGMGLVFEATQQHPRRRVAVKVLRTDKLERGRARFEEEVQLLARLTHPNIARIYAAGVCRTELAGGTHDLPYYTMEFVPGARTVLAYSADEHLNLRARVALFVPICAAVHHGHQRGIVHRDLKPDNILVTGDGIPKVIDFGIARSTRLAREQVTRTGELLGTVAYLSPEQVLDAQSADVRSDLYALGVVLFELLTGRSPYRRATTLPELLHAIANEEPRRPSQLAPQVAGDLEWILLRCLAKDPNARYAGADDLQAELQRFLEFRPVLAGPPGLVYRFRKFARRSPGAVVASGFAALSLGVGGVAAAHGYLDAVEARELAERRRSESEHQLARRQSAYEFLAGLLSLTGEKNDPNLRVRDLLDSATERLATQHEDDPELRAELYTAIGGSYHNLGLVSSATEVLERSWRIWQQAEGDDDLRTRGALRDYAMAAGRVADLYGVERLAEDAERARLAGAHDEWLWTLQQITVQHLMAGRREEALNACDEILKGPLAVRDHAVIRARVLRDRGHALAMLSRREEAVAEMAHAEALFDGAGVPMDVDSTRTARAVVLIGMGRNDEASQLLELSHAYRVENYGLNAASTAHVAVNLASACIVANPARARELLEQVLAHAVELGADHRFARAAQRKLSELLARSFGESARARELLLDLERREHALEPVPRWDLGMTLAQLAALDYLDLSYAQAAAGYQLALDQLAQVQPELHPDRCRVRASLLLCRLEFDDPLTFAALLPSARADHEAVVGLSERVHTGSALGALLVELGDEAEARRVLSEASELAAGQRVRLAPRVLAAIERLG
ncbi:MAG: serine/threonine protein kinase, partial [Planctomycetaceae bacterium]|nr:serine/threonine protein kinase [Planctomycetaceae bacterium]